MNNNIVYKEFLLFAEELVNESGIILKKAFKNKIEYEIKGLQLYAIKAPILINKAVELGKRGKTMYIWPLPFPWLFKENIDSA